jgi:hypothetical protein
MAEADDLLALPYYQRRIIVVTDPQAQSARPAAASIVSKVLFGRLAPTVAVAGLMVESVLRAQRTMREAGERLVPVSRAQAAGLRFPVGHPRVNVVYVGHPIDPPVYLPVSDFHRFLFEHKVAEAQRLIRSLGAVTVEVVRIEGWDQSAGISLGVMVPGAPVADIFESGALCRVRSQE